MTHFIENNAREKEVLVDFTHSSLLSHWHIKNNKSITTCQKETLEYEIEMLFI